jgi:hypothetical protein
MRIIIKLSWGHTLEPVTKGQWRGKKGIKEGVRGKERDGGEVGKKLEGWVRRREMEGGKGK